MPVQPSAVAADSWAIPGKVLRTSVVLLVVLLVPAAISGAAAGSDAAIPLLLAEVMSLTVAAKLAPRYAALMVALVAATAAVAVTLNGQAFAAACFAVLVCLMVAPANMFELGLLSAVPPIAAVYLASPSIRLEAPATALWTFIGGLVVVALLARVAPPAQRHGISPGTSLLHAAAMAAGVGVSVFLVVQFEVPNGYWVPMTMALVLQPFGTETRSRARQRIMGTVGGGLLALLMALLLPPEVVAVAVLPLIAVGVCYVLLDRYGKSVVLFTPGAVLLANLASRDAEVQATVQRLVATLVGAVAATALALWLERADDDRAALDAGPAE